MFVKIIRNDDALSVQEEVNTFLRKIRDAYGVIAITQSTSGTLITVMVQYKVKKV
jgi:hypothetical protein